ncbi:MAG: hemin uptake protein HemP [Alphaproteobacteria bacterium]|nr:hemin uptake protein HemP [Alphaproteobacteria bacterium]
MHCRHPTEIRPDADPPPSVVSSTELLRGGRELLIQHGQERYRLILTRSNKLILTK